MEEKLNTSTPNRRETVRTIYRSVVSLVLSFFVVIFAVGVGLRSFGWFASNKNVDASGMSVKVKGSPNLIISDDEDEVKGGISDIVALFRKSFTASVSSVTQLEPAILDTKTKKLMVVENVDIISASTGLTSGNVDQFTYIEAVENVNYLSFTVYVGVVGADLDYTNLTLSLNSDKCYAKCVANETVKNGVNYYTRSGDTFSKVTPAVGTDAEGYFRDSFFDIYNTTCVDVLLNDTYKGTVHPSTKNDAVTLSESGAITSSTPVKVTLRLYFDGALADETGKTYLRANNQKANQVFLSFLYSVD